MTDLPRPWCCPEHRCRPVHQLQGQAEELVIPWPSESFVCFGQMDMPITFVYDGAEHSNDLRSCHYTPLKGVIANQENADDWRALSNAYARALHACGGWSWQSESNPQPNAGGQR